MAKRAKKAAKPKAKKLNPYIVVAVKTAAVDPPEWCPSGWVIPLWDEGGYCGFRSWKEDSVPPPDGCAIHIKEYPEFGELIQAIALEWTQQFDVPAAEWQFTGILVDANETCFRISIPQ